MSGLFVSAHARGANRAVIFLLKRVCAYQSTGWNHKRPAGAMSARQTQDRVAKDGPPILGLRAHEKGPSDVDLWNLALPAIFFCAMGTFTGAAALYLTSTWTARSLQNMSFILSSYDLGGTDRGRAGS